MEGATQKNILSLPPICIQRIGKFLCKADRDAARCASKIFSDIHAGCKSHTIYVDRNSLSTFATRCQTSTKLMPCLEKLTIVFKNLVGPVRLLEATDLNCVNPNTFIDVAFEYCDEEFMTTLLLLPWRIDFVFIWFHNGTETPVVKELRDVLKARKVDFSTRFNSKQANSIFSDTELVSQIESAHYVVHANHFATHHGFLEPPHVISIPESIDRAHVELKHYNVLIEHPERLVTVSFDARDTMENESIAPHRERLRSWFSVDSLQNCMLEMVDIYTLSFMQSNDSSICFARHIFEVLRAVKSTAVVNIYNAVQSQSLALLREFPDIKVLLVCTTDITYLTSNLIRCFLKHDRLLISVEGYVPRPEWKHINFRSPQQIFELLPPLLKHEWFWVRYCSA